jgi:hypothetical protein
MSRGWQNKNISEASFPSDNAVKAEVQKWRLDGEDESIASIQPSLYES